MLVQMSWEIDAYLADVTELRPVPSEDITRLPGSRQKVPCEFALNQGQICTELRRQFVSYKPVQDVAAESASDALVTIEPPTLLHG